MTKLSCLAILLSLVFAGGCATTKSTAPVGKGEQPAAPPHKYEDFAAWSGILIVEHAEGEKPVKVAMLFARKGKPGVYGVKLLKKNEEQSQREIAVFNAPPDLPMVQYQMFVLVQTKHKMVAVMVNLNGCATLFEAAKKDDEIHSIGNGMISGNAYQLMANRVIQREGNCPEPEAPAQPEK